MDYFTKDEMVAASESTGTAVIDHMGGHVYALTYQSGAGRTALCYVPNGNGEVPALIALAFNDDPNYPDLRIEALSRERISE